MAEFGVWQPIETAPKDGRKLLLWFLDEPIVGSWTSFMGIVGHQEWFGHNVTWYDGHKAIQSLADGFGRGGPTHWTPLPEPPVEEESGE